MREFDYSKLAALAVPADIVKLLAQIYELKGRGELSYSQQPQKFATLLAVAKIQSTEASNRIEGIYTSHARLQKIVEETTTPRNREEQEIAGYRDVLDLIHTSYRHIPISKNSILQLHKNLYKYNQGAHAGRWKQVDNVIEEIDSRGNRRVRFTPTPALEVDQSIEQLCTTYNAAITRGTEPLVAIFDFILDFLSIHPFVDGNGRMSRLLTLLLMYRSGFEVGRYISIEYTIEKTKETYYSTLYESSKNWHEGQNDLWPFVSYSLGVLLATYLDFEERASVIADKKVTKKEQIKAVFSNQLGKITKSDIKRACPNVSEVLIEKTLKEMLDQREIEKIGAGRTTSYVKL